MPTCFSPLFYILEKLSFYSMSTSYADLVNVSSFGKKREDTFNPERGEIAFYCRDCRKIIEATRLEPQKIGKKVREYLYECPICQGRNVAIGTENGLKEHYDRKH